MLKLLATLGFYSFSVLAAASEPTTNLVQSLVRSENIRTHRLQRSQGKTTCYSFISSGLPKECKNSGSYLQNEVSVNVISDPQLAAPLRIQIVGLYSNPLSNSCRVTLANAITKLPPDTHAVSNNLNSLDRGGQLVLDFSIPRPLPHWIQDIIPSEIGGNGALPSRVEGWKLTVFCLMFLLIGFKLLLGVSEKPITKIDDKNTKT